MLRELLNTIDKSTSNQWSWKKRVKEDTVITVIMLHIAEVSCTKDIHSVNKQIKK